jgi:DNA-binding MarR family transcriptional regulator
MSAHVDRLETAGLVARRRSERDRRRIELEVTDAGHRVLRSARRRRTAWLAERLRGLAPDELERIDAALPALERLLEDEA